MLAINLSKVRAMVTFSLTLLGVLFVLPSMGHPSFAFDVQCSYFVASDPYAIEGYPNPPYQNSLIAHGGIGSCTESIEYDVCLVETFVSGPPFWNDLDCLNLTTSTSGGTGGDVGNNCLFDPNTIHHYASRVRTSAGHVIWSGTVHVNWACYY
jgi:hypothetical protein